MRTGLQIGLGASLAFALAGITVGPVAALPTASVDGEICLECHDMEQALSAPSPHQPVAELQCVSCHNPHVARFASLLRERPAALCLSCHSDLASSEDQPVVHQPVAEGRCSDCHQPHGGNVAGLLAQRPRQLCAGCHSQVESWSERAVVHVPFAQGRCSSCHQPHAGPFDSLTRRQGGDLCAECHGSGAALREVHSGYPVGQASCGTCHDPHASGRRGLLRETLHAPFEAGDCTDCHQSASSDRPFALVSPVDELCAECHGDQVEEAIAASYPHVPAGGGACLTCHSPHAGEGDGLLKQPMQTLCLSCHDPGGASSGGEFRYPTHGEGLECSECHAAHGGEQPVLLADDPVTLCGRCHAHEHSIRHPLGEEVPDPRTGSPMTCISCHGVHQAGAEMYLHAPASGELCLGCHKDIGGRG